MWKIEIEISQLKHSFFLQRTLIAFRWVRFPFHPKCCTHLLHYSGISDSTGDRNLRPILVVLSRFVSDIKPFKHSCTLGRKFQLVHHCKVSQHSSLLVKWHDASRVHCACESPPPPISYHFHLSCQPVRGKGPG